MINGRFKIKLGYAPTRKFVFSKEDALKYKELTRAKIKGMDIDLIDIDWLNDEGMLYDATDVPKIISRFRAEGVDAVFSPHCNFGTEEAVAKLAKEMGKPFLLWGPRDEYPLPDLTRLRDTQCGLFATSKILKVLNVPFTYIENCRLDNPVFERGFKNFIAATSVVKNFRNMRVGQISTRPEYFWTVIINERELLERFGIEVVPTTLVDIVKISDEKIKKKDPAVKQLMDEVKSRIGSIEIPEEKLEQIVGLKLAMQHFAEEKGLSAIAIQCFSALYDLTGVLPCFANGELTDSGIPTVCETDIHGAISSVIAQSALFGKNSPFLADLTVRHPDNDNAELLWHCGPFPHSLIAEDSPRSRIGWHFIMPQHPEGNAEWKIKGGDVSIVRFDGDNGEYRLFAGHARGTEGPDTKGTYLWIEVNDWKKWERKLIKGPYIHHVAGIHGKIAPVLYEAAQYIPCLKFDAIDPSVEKIETWLYDEQAAL